MNRSRRSSPPPATCRRGGCRTTTCAATSPSTIRTSTPDFIDKMEASTGIRARWWADDDVATSDLALPAARQALERAGRGPRTST